MYLKVETKHLKYQSNNLISKTKLKLHEAKYGRREKNERVTYKCLLKFQFIPVPNYLQSL